MQHLCLSADDPRYSEAARLIDFVVDLAPVRRRWDHDQSRPDAIARKAATVLRSAAELQGALRALDHLLERPSTELALFCFPGLERERQKLGQSPSREVRNTVVAALHSLEEWLEGLRQRMATFEARGAPATWLARHVCVMDALSIFERFYAGPYSKDHLRYKAARNKFLNEVLAAAGYKYTDHGLEHGGVERRALECHLKKIAADAARVTTGSVS
jgi:hypothetical protein